jgi:hypothetical protein
VRDGDVAAVARGVSEMSVVLAVFLIVGAAIGSFAIPPHHLFRTHPARPPLPADETVSATGKNAR